jgi:hypothetical protein
MSRPLENLKEPGPTPKLERVGHSGLATSRTLDVQGIVQITPVQVCIARIAVSAL